MKIYTFHAKLMVKADTAAEAAAVAKTYSANSNVIAEENGIGVALTLGAPAGER
jgi:hypothetical protein